MGKRNKATDIFQYIDRQTNGMDGCWIWTGPQGGRVTELRPYYGYEGRRVIAYRLVYELTHGVKLTPDQLILHSCDRGRMPIGCCNPKHLSIGTNQDNANDMKERERHGLPHNVIKNIKVLLIEGRTQQEIANLYGISRESVSAIATERVYAHVKIEDEAQ